MPPGRRTPRRKESGHREEKEKEKEKEKKDSAVSEARTFLASEDVILANKIVTIDPLHNKRETCQRVEDDHRHRRVNAAQNLTLPRNVLLAIIPFDETKKLSSWLDTYRSYPARALKLLQQARQI
jgi:hypothetical protein